MNLYLDSLFLQAIIAHVEMEYPLEACGILAGENGRVVKQYPIANTLKSAALFEMDPLQQFEAFLEIEDRGWQIAAFYHSHPQGPAHPSATDIARAHYPDVVQIIVSLQDRAKPTVKAFRIADGQAQSISLIEE